MVGSRHPVGMGMDTSGLREDIAAAAQAMANQFGAKGEIKALARHLHDGETVIRMAGGNYKGKNGLVTLTSRRIVFSFDGWTGAMLEDFPHAKVTSIEWKGGMVGGQLTVHASGNSAAIKGMTEIDGRHLAEEARRVLAGAPPVGAPAAAAPNPEQPAAASAVDPLQVLAQLRALREEGRLSEEAYRVVAGELAAL